MKTAYSHKISDEPQDDFNALKKRIYTMYVMIVKSLFTGNACEISEANFDMILAEVCVSQMDCSITHDEFKELSSYLVITYKVFLTTRRTENKAKRALCEKPAYPLCVII